MKNIKQHEKDFIHISKKSLSWMFIMSAILVINIYVINNTPSDATAIYTTVTVLAVSDTISIMSLMEIADLNNLNKED